VTRTALLWLALAAGALVLAPACADDEGEHRGDTGADTVPDSGDAPDPDLDPGTDTADAHDAAPDANGFDVPDDGPDADGLDADLGDADLGDADPTAFSVTLAVTDQWQRGPVTLSYVFQAPGGTTASVAVDYRLSLSDSFSPATPLAAHGYGAGPLAPGAGRFVWDSAADVDSDESAVELRVTVRDTATAATASATTPAFALLGEPDRPRAVLLTSSINGNTQLRRLSYTAGVGLAFDDDVHTLPAPPEGAVFDPGGRVAAVWTRSGEALALLRFAAGGAIASATRLDTPGHDFAGAAFSEDGATLYLLDFNPLDFGGGLYQLAFEAWDARPLSGASPQLVTPLYAASSFAVVPGRRGLLALGTSRDDERGAVRLYWLDVDGELLDDAFMAAEGSSGEAVAVSDDGRWALAVWSNLFSGVGGAALYELSTARELVGGGASGTVDLGWVSDVAFGPHASSAVVTQLGPDRVIGLALSPAGALTVADSEVLGAADTLARTRFGADTDLFFVTTIHPSNSELGSGLGVFRLAAGGTLTPATPFYLGAGMDKIPSGLAIQP
jgi:hypothetical protein